MAAAESRWVLPQFFHAVQMSVVKWKKYINTIDLFEQVWYNEIKTDS